MTPGDFASLQEGREGLSTEDYIAWKLPEEEDADDIPFPLTLKLKSRNGTSSGTASGATSPGGFNGVGTEGAGLGGGVNGTGSASGAWSRH